MSQRHNLVLGQNRRAMWTYETERAARNESDKQVLAQIAQMNETHVAQITQINETHVAQIEQLNARHEERMEERDNTFLDQMETARKEHKNEMRELGEQIKANVTEQVTKKFEEQTKKQEVVKRHDRQTYLSDTKKLQTSIKKGVDELKAVTKRYFNSCPAVVSTVDINGDTLNRNNVRRNTNQNIRNKTRRN